MVGLNQLCSVVFDLRAALCHCMLAYGTLSNKGKHLLTLPQAAAKSSLELHEKPLKMAICLGQFSTTVLSKDGIVYIPQGMIQAADAGARHRSY